MNGITGILRSLLCAAILVALLLQPQTVFGAYEVAPTQTVVRKQQLAIDQAAAALYKYAKEGNITEVRGRLAEIVQLFGNGSGQEGMSVEGIHAFSGAILDVQEAINAVSMSPEVVIQAAASLRLAADVIAHPKEPLWQQYYKILYEDLKAVEDQFSKGSAAGFAASVQRLEHHYNTIRPAAMISMPPSSVNRTDSWLSFVKGAVGNATDPAAVKSTLTAGRETLNVLFGREKDAAAFAPFMLAADDETMGWLIGCVILLSLVYVGFRKYWGEQHFFPPTR